MVRNTDINSITGQPGVLQRGKISPGLLLSGASFVIALTGIVWLVAVNLAQVPRWIATWSLISYIIASVLFLAWVGIRVSRTRRVALLVFAIGQVFWFAWPASQALAGTKLWYGDRQYGIAITDSEVLLATTLLYVFFCLTSIFYLLSDQWLSRRESGNAERSTKTARALNGVEILILSAMLFLLGLLPFLIFGEGIQSVFQAIIGSRAVTKGWSQAAFESNSIAIIGRASMVTFGVISLTIVFHTHRQLSRLFALLFFLLAFAVIYLDTGTRSWALLMVLPSILTWVWFRIDENRLSLRTIFFVMGLLALLVWLSQLQVSLRDTGFRSGFLTGESTLPSDDNDFFNETALVVSAVPEHTGYVFESNLVLFLTNPIPRSIWPSKPYSRVIRNYSAVRDGYDIYFTQGVSRMPSVVGQYYMSWGVLGVIQLSIMSGVFLAWLDNHWSRKNLSLMTNLWLGIASTWVFVSFRGLVPGFHYPLILLGLVVLFERSSLAIGRKSTGLC